MKRRTHSEDFQERLDQNRHALTTLSVDTEPVSEEFLEQQIRHLGSDVSLFVLPFRRVSLTEREFEVDDPDLRSRDDRRILGAFAEDAPYLFLNFTQSNHPEVVGFVLHLVSVIRVLVLKVSKYQTYVLLQVHDSDPSIADHVLEESENAVRVDRRRSSFIAESDPGQC